MFKFLLAETLNGAYLQAQDADRFCLGITGDKQSAVDFWNMWDGCFFE